MSDDPKPSFFARLALSWVAYFRTLFDADFAAGVVRLRNGAPALPAPKPEPVAEPEPKKAKKKKKKKPAPVLKTAGPRGRAAAARSAPARRALHRLPRGRRLGLLGRGDRRRGEGRA